MMSEQPGQGSTSPPTAPGHGFSAITARPVRADDADLARDLIARTSDFGRFDWFAESEDFGHAARSTARRAGNGQVAGSGSANGQAARSWWRPNLWGPSRWLRGWRLVVGVTVLAVTCTLLGGVVGGFIVVRSQGTLTDRSYSLPAVPSASTDRPASSVAGIAARDMPGVVMIKVNGDEGTGSGFLIKGGYIITDNHVVTLDGLVVGASLQVYFSNGTSAQGLLVGRDPYSDIAVIKTVGMTDLPALPLGNSAGVDVGDPVLAIGSPLGLADTVTSGIVSAVGRPVQPAAGTPGSPEVFFDAIQTDAPINPGNSGGPLVNASGQVIGIDAAIDTLGADPITGTQGGSIGLGFAIPMDQARRVVAELIRSGHATHSVIGASFNANFSGNGAQIVTGRGAVAPGGPAAQAGLQAGDVITKLGGQSISNAYSLLDAVRSLAPGSRVGVTFVGNGQTQQTELTLGSASS